MKKTLFFVFYIFHFQLVAQVDTLDNPYFNLLVAAPKMQPSLRDFILNIDANVSPFVITPSRLNELINTNQSPILLDARSQREYDVSHLKNAKRIGFEDFNTERIWMLRRTLPIVIYCTTGDRSRLLAAFMVDMGFQNIKILDGAIIQWSNEQLPLFDKKNLKTTQVHIIKKENAALLRKGKAIWN
jgi:rhodanese-related sulfurtransferase